MQSAEMNQLVLKWLSKFSQLPPPYHSLLPGEVRIRWNQRMRSRAGVAVPSTQTVELNPHLLTERKIFEEVLVHELCHLVISRRWPRASAHGLKWQNLMRELGFEPRRCHNLVVPRARLHRQWLVSCQCVQHHMVSTIIYNRLKRGRRYKCLKCNQALLLPTI